MRCDRQMLGADVESGTLCHPLKLGGCPSVFCVVVRSFGTSASLGMSALVGVLGLAQEDLEVSQMCSQRDLPHMAKPSGQWNLGCWCDRFVAICTSLPRVGPWNYTQYEFQYAREIDLGSSQTN